MDEDQLAACYVALGRVMLFMQWCDAEFEHFKHDDRSSKVRLIGTIDGQRYCVEYAYDDTTGSTADGVNNYTIAALSCARHLCLTLTATDDNPRGVSLEDWLESL